MTDNSSQDLARQLPSARLPCLAFAHALMFHVEQKIAANARFFVEFYL
ncbi:MAG: hypothetical protein FWE53_00290 [Firmicutes bacterium]|nr:hypothetical protein [Bacillota bacterium]